MERYWRVWKVEGEIDGLEGIDSIDNEEFVVLCCECIVNLIYGLKLVKKKKFLFLKRDVDLLIL